MVSKNKIKQSADSIRGYHLKTKALALVGGAIFLLVVITYTIALMYSKAGSFTVSVAKLDRETYSITLSKTDPTKSINPVSSLTCPSVEIRDLDGMNTFPYDNNIGKVDGAANGDNYLCYTFYLLNNGNLGVNVDYFIDIGNVERNLDECVRVMVVESKMKQNRDVKIYAKPREINQETHETKPEVGTIPFEDSSTVCSETINNFLPDEYYKYTIVIWIEGPDRDTEDDKLGGSFKIDMKFEVSGTVEGTEKENQ